jgi:hypothetical protein
MSKRIIAKSVAVGAIATVAVVTWLVIAAGFLNVAI